jgi:hypothetical protein
MAGELEYDLFSIDLYGWGARICYVFHRFVWLGSSNMFCFPYTCLAGELEYDMFSIDLYGWGARIYAVFHRPVWLGS